MMDGAPTSDPELIRIGKYLTCAEAFGWTQQEVDNTESYLLEGVLVALSRKRKRELE